MSSSEFPIVADDWTTPQNQAYLNSYLSTLVKIGALDKYRNAIERRSPMVGFFDEQNLKEQQIYDARIQITRSEHPIISSSLTERSRGQQLIAYFLTKVDHDTGIEVTSSSGFGEVAGRAIVAVIADGSEVAVPRAPFTVEDAEIIIAETKKLEDVGIILNKAYES